MLLIKAKGGLGNRLLSAATAIAYAEATNRNWCIDWRDGLYAPNGINAIDHLFQIPARCRLVEIDQSGAVLPAIWAGRIDWPVRAIIARDYPAQHSNPLIYRKLSAALSVKADNEGIEVFWSYTAKFGRIKRYLSPEQRKLGRDQLLGQILVNNLIPQQRITDAAEKLLSAASGEVLAVHIRYTDLKVPIKKLIARVKVELRKFQYQAIYLATDSQTAEDLFRQSFANVISQQRRYPAANQQLHSVADYSEKLSDADAALVDMVALSRCKGMVYCSRSTFSEISRLYGDFEADRLVDVDHNNWQVRIKKWLQEYL